MDYIIIDLKSFYASVECVERGLNPMTTDLVVADPERNGGTICLAVSPSLKAKGVKNRCRVYEIPKQMKYIMAPPRMKLYIDYSAAIYEIYLKYVAVEDIHVYSIDESFMDVTGYVQLYKKTPKEIGQMIMQDIYRTTGITATCGVGPNLYLAKVALDIVSKHVPDHIGVLTEESYIKSLWYHQPITDFWMIGPGKAARLKSMGIVNQKGIAEADEDMIYKKFGVDAELLIDHAWGRETTTMQDIKNYRSKEHSLSNGQILLRDYEYDEALIVVKEMADLLCLDLVEKNVLAESVSMYVGYSYVYGVAPTGGTVKLMTPTSSVLQIMPELERLYYQTTIPCFPIRQIGLSANRIKDAGYRQYDLFHTVEDIDKEIDLQHSIIEIKKKYGKNAVLKGMNYLSGGTTIERNNFIGGHKAGEIL